MIASFKYHMIRTRAAILAKDLNARPTNLSIDLSIFTLSKEILLSKIDPAKDDIPVRVDIDFAFLAGGEWQPMEAIYCYSDQDQHGSKKYPLDPDIAYFSWLETIKQDSIEKIRYLLKKGGR